MERTEEEIVTSLLAESGPPVAGTLGLLSAHATPAKPIPAGDPVAEAAPPALDTLAALLLAGAYAQAAQCLGPGGDPELAAACSLPQRVLAGFGPDVGRTVPVQLVEETVTCEVEGAVEEEIRVQVLVQRGQTRGRIRRTLAYADLAVEEKLRRLGADDTPERNLMRGLLAVEAGRSDIARKLFEKAGGPLGGILAREVAARRVAAKDAAAELAVAELLRQVSRSPRLDDHTKVIASIRDRCGENSKRVLAARKLLAEFEQKWGASEAGKEWVPVVRDALTYPYSGVDWTVPEVGMEFVWIKPMEMWVGKYEVTNGEYRKKDPKHDSKAWGRYGTNGDRQPAVLVNWSEISAYADWLTEREQAAGRLPTSLCYRLPTEAEFMVYAQCGNKREFPWGNEWPPKTGQAGNYSGQESAWKDKMIDYRDDYAVTCDVDKSWPNPWGLYGVGGNAWECCAVAGAGRKQSFGAWRGASWNDYERGNARCAVSGTFSGNVQYIHAGFRLALSR